jgi:RNase P subunit RPR2
MWWKRKKCATCKTVLKPKRGIHELRLNAADGVVDLEICGKCADFWDKSADVLLKRGNDENYKES